MIYPKILFYDCESTSLDPKISSIREMAFVAEVEGEQIGDIQSYKVQPILHSEDMVYGEQDIYTFCSTYNKRFHAQDPDKLEVFCLKDTPLFFYSKSVLTFNLPAPQIADPSLWLLGDDKLSAYKALMVLNEYLSTITDVAGRWVLAGHNISYDFNVLMHWAGRILGIEDSKILLENINKYVFLDTLALTRWSQYSGRLKTQKANLSAVASELGIDTADMHSAKADVFAAKEIAKILTQEKSNS